MAYQVQTIIKLWQDHPVVHKSPVISGQYQDIKDLLSLVFCPGPSYYYLFDFPGLAFKYIHPNAQKIHGIDPNEFSVGTLLENYLHPEDVEYFLKCEEKSGMFLYQEIAPHEILQYKICYCFRLKDKSGKYKMFLRQAFVVTTDDQHKIISVFGVHTDISHITMENNHLLSFIHLNDGPSYFRQKVDLDKPLPDETKPLFTPRQIEVIRLLAEGLNYKEVADILSIAPDTARTHQKNILDKSGCKNMVQVVVKCIKEGII